MMKKYGKLCPLIKDPSTYTPDTIDLSSNDTARHYWLSCLEGMVKKFICKASYLAPDSSTATARAEICWEKFHNHVENIKSNPTLFNPLSVRTLLDFNERTLQDNNFEDAWHLQKETETKIALTQYQDRVKFIDGIDNYYSKWVELAKGIIAGNMFDWGAKAVTDIIEGSNGFGLAQAMAKIQKRPWFQDDLDQWVHQLQRKPYQLAVIFIDNAGVDFILGVVPFARQLLKEGTRVILTANSAPALNDVTYSDLKCYLHKLSQKCPVVKESLLSNNLISTENGQRGPCLDLRNLTPELCNAMSEADLIILEGMGRAIHTNLNAEFKVDCLKLAVLKNEWLAKSLGAQQFSVIYEYDPAPESINV